MTTAVALAPTETPSTAPLTPFKPRIRVLREYRYLVESASQPGVGHQVDTLRLKCGCTAGQYGKRCKHLVLAIQYEDWRKRQRRG
jgi:hypothetical protein